MCLFCIQVCNMVKINVLVQLRHKCTLDLVYVHKVGLLIIRCIISFKNSSLSPLSSHMILSDILGKDVCMILILHSEDCCIDVASFLHWHTNPVLYSVDHWVMSNFSGRWSFKNNLKRVSQQHTYFLLPHTSFSVCCIALHLPLLQHCYHVIILDNLYKHMVWSCEEQNIPQ